MHDRIENSFFKGATDVHIQNQTNVQSSYPTDLPNLPGMEYANYYPPVFQNPSLQRNQAATHILVPNSDYSQPPSGSVPGPAPALTSENRQQPSPSPSPAAPITHASFVAPNELARPIPTRYSAQENGGPEPKHLLTTAACPSIPSPPLTPAPHAHPSAQRGPNNELQPPFTPTKECPSHIHLPSPTHLDSNSAIVDTAPKFKHGIVAAVAAHRHLRLKSGGISDLLESHGIDETSWTAQTGFRIEASQERRFAGFPPVLHQEISIVISGRPASKKKLTGLLKGLRRHVSPYYGTLKFSESAKTWDLESQSQDAANGVPCEDALSEECSKTHEATFHVNPSKSGELPFLKLSVANFAGPRSTQSGENHVTTLGAFELIRDDNSPPGSNAAGIKCSELKFGGPSSYLMQGAYVRVKLDKESQFRDTTPEELYDIDIAAQLKHNSQRTTKESKTVTGKVELGKAPKIGGSVAAMRGTDNMDGVETVKNPWNVWQEMDGNSQTVHYWSQLPAFDHGAMLPEKLRPTMKFLGPSQDQLPTTVTIRLWSFWKLIPEPHGGRLERAFDRLRTRLFGSKRQRGGNPKPRAYTNFAHCTEIDVPLDFIGSASETVTREDILETFAA